MKTLFKTVVLALLFFATKANAQAPDIVNSNFLTVCSTLVTSTSMPSCWMVGGRCPIEETFNYNIGGPCVQNWYRSSGIPRFDDCWGPSGYNWINMFSATNDFVYCEPNDNIERGQAIVGGYNFIKGNGYVIEATFDCLGGVQGGLKFYAANGIPYTNQLTDPVEIISSPPSYSFIGNYHEVDLSGVYVKTYYFPFYANDNYSQLWIYSYNDHAPNELGVFETIVSGVHIFSCIAGHLSYSTGVIPTSSKQQVHTASDIHIGNLGTIVTVDPDTPTVLIATETIVNETTEGFEAVVNDGYFAIYAVSECIEHDYEHPTVDPIHQNDKDVLKRARNNYNTNNINTANDITLNYLDSSGYLMNNSTGQFYSRSINLYPDPTTGIVNLRYYNNNYSDNLNIVVKNMTGIVVKTENTYCNQNTEVNQQIDLSSLPNGVYLVEVTVGNQHAIKKVTKL